MIKGCFTALITPFEHYSIDREGLEKIIDFQIQNGINGILAVGTTGESPSLSWHEHNETIEYIAGQCRNRCCCIAGTGSNNTRECIEATGHAAQAGASAVLLVDPYYNGPSSLEIRREYIAPVAEAFPAIDIIPYVIPGRTGTQLLPEDLALLSREFENVKTVKEATGNLGNMRRTRELCGPDFSILSGDDGMTFDMMTDSEINASGVISVISNIIPKAVTDMVTYLKNGQTDPAQHLADTLAPLFNLVSFKTIEKTPFGDVAFKARNPLPVKTLMSILGMPSGMCRRPLGKMTFNAINVILDAARRVQSTSPEIFQPIADYFHVDIDDRLNNSDNWKDLCYENY